MTVPKNKSLKKPSRAITIPIPNFYNGNYLTGLVTGILVGLLLFVLVPKLVTKGSSLKLNLKSESQITPAQTSAVDSGQITKSVLPEKYNLGISFGETIKKLVDAGAIDKQKFLDLYKERGGLQEEFAKLLDGASDDQITVTADNSGIILNLLWPLGIANKTKLLADGPMSKDAANYASTGGWTLGREDGGKLFNRFPIFSLTVKEEALVTEIAQGIYRPCCGNSTYFPDCNHGAAMLGFIELAVVQGMPKDEIYKKALVLNSYWFPQTYVELATYFKSEKNIDWNKIDPKEVLGGNYSSGQGYLTVNKELQAKGLIPKVEGGGGCGV